ncbi:hypothetical protein Lepto7376_2864 [[Leptolyngbya] sp. PCC 7376]|uniref:prepilin-type N-terminal cleavage/methylation domain-containing protein n=1 Tax=[Leptolyngbya] sp. PCC 7376 TaxID=111781 RepID=UPI00029EFE29|nr:prepilin-type N-terminal cleavage/methylation domain-containing protein [[Leptolyngbya] sp. PCC 7376]AFY39116.1 hypothetical protein Lepto7376_2864 [[Leptolyngbya] sp. PCC 7376]
MNTFSNYFASLIKSDRSKGFTLIELLVAIALSGIVIVGLGAGMVAVLGRSKSSATKTDLKNQLNRAIDYINDDIKRSRVAGLKQTNVSNDTLILTYYENINDTSGHTIEYYLDSVASNEPWLGPNVLRRKVDSGNWQVLVDGLTDRDSTFTCSSSNFIPVNLGGFQACIESQQASNGNDIYRTTVALFGEVSSSEVVEVSSATISRSVTPTVDPPVLSFTPDTALEPTITWDPIIGATSYSIYECTTTNTALACPFSDAILTPLNISVTSPTSQLDTTTAVGGERSCYYGVTNSGAASSQESEAVCTIVAPSAAPSDVASADLIVTDETVPTVSWTQDFTATQYQIYRCTALTGQSSCSIDVNDPTTYTIVDDFVALTSAAFDEKVPWTETETPNDGERFCYGVIVTNSLGHSSITGSNTKCGAAVVGQTINTSWNISFVNFDTSAVEPQDITWDEVPGATRYELRRCTTDDGTECEPSSGTTVLDDAATDLSISSSVVSDYDENNEPGPAKRYCYAVRAKDDTQASNFSTKQCTTPQAGSCTLNLVPFGKGSSPSFVFTDDPDFRQTLLSGVTASKFSTVTSEKQNLGAGYEILFEVQENSTGSFVGVQGSNTVSLPCDTSINIVWWFNGVEVEAPVLSIDLTDSGSRKDYKPEISWNSVAEADRYDVYRCTEAGADCVPSSTDLHTANSTSPDLETTNPSNGSRWCYSVKAVDTDTSPSTESAFSNVLCGNDK